MFKPIVKQRHVGALMRMATQSGRDPNEILHELLDQATSSEAPPTAADPNASGAATTSRALNEPAVAKKARHNAINAAAGREDGDPASAMAALEASEAKAVAEGETDEAPPDLMKGDRPNPLRTSMIKQWASGKSPEAPSFSNGPEQETDDDERRAQLRRKYLAPAGRPQR